MKSAAHKHALTVCSLSATVGRMRKSRTIRDRHFRFMDLPAELRNSIYELALVDRTNEAPISIIKRHGRSQDGSHGPRALLEVSQQVRKETLPIYYGGNSFSIHTTEEDWELYVWLHAVGPDALRCLQHLDIRAPTKRIAYGRVPVRMKLTGRGAKSKGDKRMIVCGNSFDCFEERMAKAQEVAGRLNNYCGIGVTVEIEDDKEYYKRICCYDAGYIPVAV